MHQEVTDNQKIWVLALDSRVGERLDSSEHAFKTPKVAEATVGWRKAMVDQL